MRRRWPARCSKHGATMSTRARPKANADAVTARPGRRGRGGRRRHGHGRAATRAGRQAWRAARVRGAAGRAGRRGRRARGGFQRIALGDYIATRRHEAGGADRGRHRRRQRSSTASAGPGTAGGETIAALIETALSRRRASRRWWCGSTAPAGRSLASERIRQALLAPRPRACRWSSSMGSVAASGGYWVATPADLIFAEPSTITGSIGVFGVLPSFEGTLAKLGIGADGVKTTPLSGEPDLLRGPSPAANALIQAGVESIYRRFLSIVAQSRHKRRRKSTGSPRGGCGTAARRARSGWSIGSAGSTRRSPAAAQRGEARRRARRDPARTRAEFSDQLLAHARRRAARRGEPDALAYAVAGAGNPGRRSAGAVADVAWRGDDPGDLHRMPGGSAGRGLRVRRSFRLACAAACWRRRAHRLRRACRNEHRDAGASSSSDSALNVTTHGLCGSLRPCRSMMWRPHSQS